MYDISSFCFENLEQKRKNITCVSLRGSISYFPYLPNFPLKLRWISQFSNPYLCSFPRAVQTEIYTDKHFWSSKSAKFECRLLSAAGENFEIYESNLDEMLVNLQYKAVDFRVYLC